MDKKEILVGVDFSKGSLHALKYAINLANELEANVQMVWVDTLSKDSLTQRTGQDLKKEIKERFNELIDSNKKNLKHGKFSFKLRKGKVYEEIANQAKYTDAYLTIIGTHGVTGFEEFWIGSNAFRVVTYSPCPVITLRHDYRIKKKLEKIVLPIDSTLETRQKVPFTTGLANYFPDIEVHILALHSYSSKTLRLKVSKYAEQVGAYLEKYDVQYKIKEINAENITNETLKYAQDINADLISIMTEQETAASNIWLGPYAQQMVNHSPIPVLTIHPKEFFDIATK